MTNYERPSFKKKWWEKVENYLKENPSEGFEEDEVKRFIKVITNKYMEGTLTELEEQSINDLIEKLEEMKKEKD